MTLSHTWYRISKSANYRYACNKITEYVSTDCSETEIKPLPSTFAHPTTSIKVLKQVWTRTEM